MASAAAPLFYHRVEYDLTIVLLLAFLVVDIVAFVNCLTQRADAFPVVGSLTKQAWLAILGGAILITVICSLYAGYGVILGFVGITASAIYMLDVRPALRDTSNGTGSW